MEWILIGIVWGVIWGIVVKKVVENKGYDENWFWWGFFFGIFALIVAAAKPAVTKASNNAASVLPSYPQSTPKEKEIPINEISADRIDIRSAVHISSWNIQKQNNEVFLIVNFFNLSDNIITAVLLTAQGFNSFGDSILVNEKEVFLVMGQDMSVKPSKHGQIRITVPDSDIRKVKLKVAKWCFANGDVVTACDSKWVETKQQALDPLYWDCVKDSNPHGAYHAIIQDDYWQCVCGFVNSGTRCKVCNMSKANAAQFTTDAINGTYAQYLEKVEAEQQAERARRKEERGRTEEAKVRAENERKATIRKRIICACVAVVAVIGVSVAAIIISNRTYQSEMAQIATLIENNEYDKAYSIMISSKKYEKIAETYGEILWKKQIELDNSFSSCSWYPIYDKEQMIFRQSMSRNGICYYELEEEFYGLWDNIYAVFENRDPCKIFGVYRSNDEGYSSIEGMGYYGGHSTIWSNGWMLISSDVYRSENYSEFNRYAIKYDESSGKALEVELPGYGNWFKTISKMKDGNIVFTEYRLETIEKGKVWIFDVVDGTMEEITPNKLERIYGNFTDNILYTRTN